MKKENIETTPGSASEWYDLGVSLMRQTRFGDAINAFSRAARLASGELDLLSAKDVPDPSPSLNPDSSPRATSLNDIKRKSLASIEVIQEIIGFVNKDLMNP